MGLGGRRRGHLGASLTLVLWSSAVIKPAYGVSQARPVVGNIWRKMAVVGAQDGSPVSRPDAARAPAAADEVSPNMVFGGRPTPPSPLTGEIIATPAGPVPPEGQALPPDVLGKEEEGAAQGPGGSGEERAREAQMERARREKTEVIAQGSSIVQGMDARPLVEGQGDGDGDGKEGGQGAVTEAPPPVSPEAKDQAAPGPSFMVVSPSLPDATQAEPTADKAPPRPGAALVGPRTGGSLVREHHRGPSAVSRSPGAVVVAAVLVLMVGLLAVSLCVGPQGKAAARGDVGYCLCLGRWLPGVLPLPLGTTTNTTAMCTTTRGSGPAAACVGRVRDLETGEAEEEGEEEETYVSNSFASHRDDSHCSLLRSEVELVGKKGQYLGSYSAQ